MAKIEIEVGDDGKVNFEALPDPLKKPFQTEFDRAYGKGAAKAAEEAKTQLESEIGKLKKTGGLDPAERERLRTLEADHSKLAEEIARRDKKYEEANGIREERYQRELREREEKVTAAQAEIQKRDARITQLAQSEIAVAAVKAGAREESLPELRKLLGDRIGLDADLNAFVKDEKDPTKPAVDKDGKPVSVDGLVTEYLAKNAHHKAAPGGRGGGAPGGRSLSGQVVTQDSEKQAALDRVKANPTPENVARAFAMVGKTKAT